MLPLFSYQNYVDYHKCVNAKGEEFAPCKQFLRTYRSLCPNGQSNRRSSACPENCETY